MQAEFTEIGFHVEVHSFIATPHKIQFHCYQFSLLSHQTNVLNTLFSVLPCLHSAGIVLFQISVSVYLSFYELVLCLQYSSCENPTSYWELFVVNNHWTGILKWKTGLNYQIPCCIKNHYYATTRFTYLQNCIQPEMCREWCIPRCTCQLIKLE